MNKLVHLCLVAFTCALVSSLAIELIEHGTIRTDEMMVLAQLHPEMAKAAGEEEEEVVVEESSKKASRPRPQPRSASRGTSRLGGVSKAASGEIAQLEQLWDSPPDVSAHFS